MSGLPRAEAARDVPLEIGEWEITATATDPDGDFLEITGVSATSARGGTVTFSGSTITYTPPAGFVGFDQFSYTLSDGPWGGTATGFVEINVTGEPPAGGAPVLSSFAIQGGNARATLDAVAGLTYKFQRSEDLMVWTDVETVTPATAGPIEFQDPVVAGGKAFYRVAINP